MLADGNAAETHTGVNARLLVAYDIVSYLIRKVEKAQRQDETAQHTARSDSLPDPQPPLGALWDDFIKKITDTDDEDQPGSDGPDEVTP